MEQKEILQRLVILRTNILDLEATGVEKQNLNIVIKDEELTTWHDGFHKGLELLKNKVVNLINNEINSIIGVDIIGKKY